MKRVIALMMACAAGQSCQPQLNKVEKYITTHENCCGGSCSGIGYKMWKDSLTCYIVTKKAVPYSIKQLSELDYKHLFKFIENDKSTKILVVKLNDASDTRHLQGFICDVLSE